MEHNKGELTIARAMLLGCRFEYDDYGHPERSGARKYWQCIGPNNYAQYPHDNKEMISSHVTGYGHTQHEAAYDWIRRTGRLELFI